MTMAAWDWIWRGLLTILFIGNVFWVKKWISKREIWEDTHSKEVRGLSDKLTKEGGMLTRDQYFKFCKEARDQCPIMMSFEDILSKGGMLMKDEHADLCMRINERWLTMTSEQFKQIRDGQSETNKKIDALVIRIDRHIDSAHHGNANKT